jgi:hypothetical protein
VRESWLVEDRWWTAEPLRRRYWELVGERGRNVVVFHDLSPGGAAHDRASGPAPLAEDRVLADGERGPGGVRGGWFLQSS